ncbi:MAG TPA: GAF domain-containing protein [Anaerolineae bacterium]|nr:GAF domain-containing protein [Anaerolineae bacterium]HQI83958.1 GAF domain-containing protein [Anaerolineae bacterium]
MSQTLQPEASQSRWLREQRSRVINMLLWVVVLAGPLAILPGIVNLFKGTPFSVTLGIYLLAYSVAVLLLVVRRISDTWRALLFVSALYAFAVFALYSGWLVSSGRTFLLVFIMMAALLMDMRAGFVAAALSVLTYLAFAVVYNQGILRLRTLPDPTTLPPILVEGGGFIIVIGLMVMAAWFFNQAILATAQATRAAEQARAALSERAAELEAANARLDRRTEALTATAQIAYDVTSVLDTQRLLDRLVRLMSETFGFYEVGVFLVDAMQQWAVLQAAEGEIGRRLLAQNYRLALGVVGGGQTLVQEVIARMTHRSRVLAEADVANSDWPETRSELVLPLRVQGGVIGVLDLHRRVATPFEAEEIAVFQTLADQAAVAVNTAQLVQRVEAAAEAERQARGELTREAWLNLLRAQPDLGYLANRQGVFALSPGEQPATTEGERTAPTVVSADRERLAMPVRVGEQVIGVLEGRRSGGWAAEEISLLETLLEQLGATVERARLYRETQRAAARERTIGAVTSRIRETLDMEAMLHTATDQIRAALNLDGLIIRLVAPQTDVQAD